MNAQVMDSLSFMLFHQ